MAGGMIGAHSTSVDGITSDAGQQGNGDEPSPDAVQEFTVQTSGISADSTWTAGGAYVMTLKSGTNYFHGSAYGFLANEDLDANTWENNYFGGPKNGYPRPLDRYHDWGVTAGGPIYLPKIYDGRNRTFIFGSYEKYSQKFFAFTQDANTTPTTAFLNGDFSALLGPQLCSDGTVTPCMGSATPMTIQNDAGQTVPLQKGMIFDPLTQNVFTGNMIPSNRISTQTQKLLGLYNVYKPENSNLVDNYASLGTGAQPVLWQGNWDAKIDENFSVKNHLSWSFDRYAVPYWSIGGLFEAGTQTPGPLSTSGAGFYTYNQTRVIDTYSITPTLLNVFAAADNWFVSRGYSLGSVDDQALGFPTFGLWTKTLPVMSFGCANTVETVCEDAIGGPTNGLSSARQIVFQDDVTWIKGRHTLHFGWNVHHQYAYIAGSGGGLSYSYSSATGIPSALYNNTQVSQHLGFGFANFLLGDVGSASQGEGIPNSGGFYATSLAGGDTFKATPKLTLVLGWRWDYNGREHDTYGQWPNFDINAQNPAWAPLNGAMEWTTNSSQSWYANEDHRLFAPSIGGAYKISKRLVARSSFSVAYLPFALGNMSSANPTPYNNQVGYVGTSLATAQPNAVAFNWDQTVYGGVYTPPTRNPDANAMYPGP